MELSKPLYEDASTGQKYELLTFDEYKEKINSPTLTSPTLDYQISIGNIDFIKLGKYRYIVYNEKAQAYCPGKNYGKRWKNKKV